MTNSTQNARFRSAHEDEERRVAWILTWLSGAAILFLLGIGTEAWMSGHVIYGATLMLFAVPIVANMLVFRKTGNRRLHKVGLLTTIAILFGYLITSGGEANTGPLWFYVFPPLVFFLTNLKVGSILIAGCLLFTAVVFRFPHLPFVMAEYSRDFQLRFVASILFESVFCFVLDYSRRRARNELISMAALYERASRTDELTGLSNRRDMQFHLAKEYARYERSGHHFSVVLIDLDHFKKINDHYGHDAGDHVLTVFSELTQRLCRKADIASRWGGEEFLLLLPDTSLLQALAFAERLRLSVAEQPFRYQDETIEVTLSAGVCSITQSGSLDNLLRLADENLYLAKQQGRNQIIPRVRQSQDSEADRPSSNTQAR
ncbi:GGDEF domain-containing protein [Marinobacteraceae bacterium S3BR75-40.1]